LAPASPAPDSSAARSFTLPPDAVAMLRWRPEHGVYGLPSGRINLAGIPVSPMGGGRLDHQGS
jgi:hypothetical protein